MDCPNWFEDLTDRSLRLDGDDRPHIAYGGDNLYYASYEDGAWQVETADPSPQVGQHAALDLDADGYPHISYCDAANEALKYAHKDAAGWHVEPVDAGLYPYAPPRWRSTKVFRLSAIAPLMRLRLRAAIARAGSPKRWSLFHTQSVLSPSTPWKSARRLCTDFAAGLRYAYNDGDGWQVQVVTGAASSSAGVSLALDSDNRPHLSYASGSAGPEMRYAFHDGVAWQFETIDPSAPGGNISLALRADGTPIASYVQEVGDHGEISSMP